MTDKIIIDGVDVTECVYRDHKNRCCCDSSKENTGEERLTGRGGCEYNPNCYYKQLQREKQISKDMALAYKDVNLLLQKRTTQLEDEKEKVRKLGKILKQAQNGNLKEIVKLIRKNGLEDHIVFQLLDIESKNKNKYKQILEEIKKMLKISMSTTNGNTHFKYVTIALAKLNEVLKDEQ